jgi:hypothetical protein
MKLIIRDTKNWYEAVKCAKEFNEIYPEDRVGFHKGVVYCNNYQYFYVYRTKTAIVVRGA